MTVRLLAVLLCLLTLCSCSFLPGGDVELLAAPMLGRQQAEVNRALQSTLDLSRVVYCYPQSGAYRSPFVFFDMDGDGLDEAIVLYFPDATASDVRAMVLRQHSPGDWYLFHDQAGRGNQVSFVSFAGLFEGRGSNLIIGWNDLNFPGRSYLGVYSILGDTFSEDLMESYSTMTLFDFDDDSLSELVMVQRSNDGHRIRLMRELRGELLEVDSAPLYYETSDTLQMLRGMVWDGVSRFHTVYVDEEVAGSFYATEAFRVDGRTLTLLAGGEGGEEGQAWKNYQDTFREDRILSTELQGVIRVPRTEELPGGGQAAESGIPRLTKYMHLTVSGFVTQFNTVVNAEAGYMVFFPARWMGNVTVQNYPERSEWRFYKVSPETGRLDGELLRIRVYSVQDFQDDMEGGIELSTKGIFRYWAYLPSSTREDPLAITDTELRTMFALLSVR